jgi:hypothetical protein
MAVQRIGQSWQGSTFGADRGSNDAPNDNQSTVPNMTAALEYVLKQIPPRGHLGRYSQGE